MTIGVGSKIPDVTLKTMTANGPSDISTADVFANKKVVLIAVPGAFTPTCHLKHVPGFIENHANFVAKGIDTVAVVSVNDVHVMGVWEKETGGSGKLLYLADGSGEFTKSIGMEIDLGAAGLGVRSKRYAMVVESGVVAAIKSDDVPSDAEESSADSILAIL